VEYAEQKTALVEAYVGLLEAERALEQLLDLEPGGLGDFVQRVMMEERVYEP